MSIKPRTIDNLGREASEAYAQNQALVDPTLLEDSQLIPTKIASSASAPFYTTTDQDPLFGKPPTVSWALFPPPPDYKTGLTHLFSHKLIPSLGDYEKQDETENTLQTLPSFLREPQEDAITEQERQTLVGLYEKLNSMDTLLALINNNRNKFHRG